MYEQYHQTIYSQQKQHQGYYKEHHQRNSKHYLSAQDEHIVVNKAQNLTVFPPHMFDLRLIVFYF